MDVGGHSNSNDYLMRNVGFQSLRMEGDFVEAVFLIEKQDLQRLYIWLLVINKDFPMTNASILVTQNNISLRVTLLFYYHYKVLFSLKSDSQSAHWFLHDVYIL